MNSDDFGSTMKCSTDLFDLIKSLSKSEKRYFKLFSSLQGGEKKYMQLFDAVDAQKEYDEAELKAKFAGERFLAQFNVAKKYLYDLLIKSLLVYHAESTVSGEIKEMIRSVEMLFERGLIAQARKILTKAIGLAELHEEFGLLVEALKWQHRIEGKSGGKTVEKIEAFHEQLLDAMGRLREVIEQERITFQMEILASQVGIRSAQEGEEKMARLVGELQSRENEETGSITSRLISYWTFAFYHHGRNDYPQALAWTTRQVELLEENPHFLFEHPRIYIKVLNNQIMLSRCVFRRDEFLASIEKLQRMAPALLESRRIRNPGVRAELFSTIYAQQMGAMVAEGEFERVIALAEELEAGLREYGEFLNDHITARLLHLLCYAHFGLNDFHRALEYNNRVIAFRNPDLDGGLGLYARILRLLIYFELGESDYLEYLLRQTRRYLQRNRCATQYACAILSLFERLPELCSPHDIQREFSSAEKTLRCLEEEPSEATVVRYFDFREWLRGKIEHRKFADIIRTREGGIRSASDRGIKGENWNDREEELLPTPVAIPS